jgi:hypothetical protein
LASKEAKEARVAKEAKEARVAKAAIEAKEALSAFFFLLVLALLTRSSSQSTIGIHSLISSFVCETLACLFSVDGRVFYLGL